MAEFWTMQEGKLPKTVDIYLYGNVVSDTTDWWTGEDIKSKTSANTMREQLEGFGQLDEVNLYINSFGGSCFEGHAIANMLRRCKAKTIAHVDAYACSVASVIACACDEVRMPKNTIMMIHDAWAFCSGNATELRKIADDLDVQNNAFKTIYLDKAGDKLPADKLDEMLRAETYLTAEDCLAYGLCDVIETFDTELKNPPEDAKTAAKQWGVDADKVCAMVTSSLLQKAEPEPEPQPEPEPEPVPAEPQQTIEDVNREFRQKAATLFLNHFTDWKGKLK